MAKGPSASEKRLGDLGTDEVPALGFIELSSISRGLFLTDAVLKKALVKIIASHPISSGKHVLLFMGDVASVEESQKEALALADGTVVKQIIIPNIHAGLVLFLDSLWQSGFSKPALQSVGIVESTTLAAAVLAEDRALKSADVSICRFRLGQGIGGKAYFVLTGKQEDVEASLEAAKACLQSLESFNRVDIIPRPQNEALAYF